jgi:hypothetical protein
MPFEKFKSRIVKTTAQEEIENWKSSSSKVQIFIPKVQDRAADKIELQSADKVKTFFVENLESQFAIQYNSLRVSGETVTKMPRSLLTKSMCVLVEKERAFPLNFANNLRGRLRRSGFTISKIGGKGGIGYISGIRRKFGDWETIFADDIQRIISHMDANPKISIMSLYFQCAQGNGDRGNIIANVGEDEGRVVDPESTAMSTEVEKSKDSSPVVPEVMSSVHREF